MPIEGLSCPSCGGPVSQYQERQQVACAYCGTGLMITRDNHGDLAAVIAGIRADTDLLYIGLEYQQLRLDLERLNHERARLYDPVRGRNSAAQLRAAIQGFFGMMILLPPIVGGVYLAEGIHLGGALLLFLSLEVMLALWVVAFWFEARRMEKLEAPVKARSPALDEEIHVVEARMHQLETVLNRAVPGVVPTTRSAADEKN